MKKLLYGVLALVTVFALAGCKGKETNEPTQTPETTVTETTTSGTETSETPETSTQETKTSTEETGNENYEELVEQLPEEALNKAKENVKELEVSEEDNKIVFKQSDIMTAIYYHDGEKLTGYEVYIDYESPELAAAAKAEAEADVEADQAESITIEGNRLHVVFKEEAYQDTSLDEVRQSVQLLQAIQGAE